MFFTRYNRDPQYILRELFKKAQLNPYGTIQYTLMEAGFWFMKPILPSDIELEMLAATHAEKKSSTGPKSSFITGSKAVTAYIEQWTPVDARAELSKDLIDNPLDLTIRQLSYLAPILSRTPSQLIKEIHNGLKPMQNSNWKSKYKLARIHSKAKDEVISELKMENGNLKTEITRLQSETRKKLPSENT